jgi:hypothetical protein
LKEKALIIEPFAMKQTKCCLPFSDDSKGVAWIFQRQALGASGIDRPDKKVRESGAKNSEVAETLQFITNPNGESLNFPKLALSTHLPSSTVYQQGSKFQVVFMGD